MLKNQKWAYWVGVIFYLLQIIEIHTQKIYYNFTSGLSFKISFNNVHQLYGVNVIESKTINIFAIIMLILIITILLKKDEDNDIPFHIRNT